MSGIPASIVSVFEELQTEVTWLHGRWKIYQQLFGHSDQRIDLLNECAGACFYVVQETLLADVLVTLSKLTDPASTGRNDNLSLEQLQFRVEAHGELKLAAALRTLLDELHKKCKPFRVHRNKRLAHLDLATALKSSTNPLPGVSRQMVSDALEVLRHYMNRIQIHYEDSEQGYEHFIMQSDGDALVAMLKYGLRYEELVRAESVAPDDWTNGTWKDA